MIDTQKVMIDTQKVMIAKLQKSSKALNLGILKKLFTGSNFKNFKNFKRACVHAHEEVAIFAALKRLNFRSKQSCAAKALSQPRTVEH